MPGYSLRRHARRDKAEPDIKAVLKAAGWSVQPLSLRDGPDLLCGAYGWFCAVAEVKSGNQGKVKAGQSEWHGQWRGLPVRVLRSVDDARSWVEEVQQSHAVA